MSEYLTGKANDETAITICYSIVELDLIAAEQEGKEEKKDESIIV